MPDYREMYQRMFMASEKAIDLLIEAQQECEDLYINAPETEIRLAPKPHRDVCPEETKEQIRALFQKAMPFDCGELFHDPEYDRHMKRTFEIETQMEETYGEGACQLLQEFLNACFEATYFENLHYFQQGYLAAQAELWRDEKE